VRKLLGRSDIEDALKRLDTLTTDEARIAIAKNLNVVTIVDNKVTVLMKSGQDTLKVTENVHDKVSVLINGGLYAFSLVIHAFLKIDTNRRERNKGSRTAVGRRRIL
jgi:hypothetical protein